MRLTHVELENYRAHKHTKVPLEQFGCLIGENNAGKSSVLHAIQFVLDDKKLTPDDYRDPECPVTVRLRIEGIGEEDLLRVDESHRERVREMLRDGALTIVRSQAPEAKAVSEYMKLIPRDKSWHESELESAMKGKKGADLRQAVIDFNPKVGERLSEKPTQQEAKDILAEDIRGLSRDELEETPAPYPTGIAQGVKPLLPSVIYVEAVKEASVEAKATGSSAFSRLLELLLNEVSNEFSDITNTFRSISEKLNCLGTEKGSEDDNRLGAVKQIESTIERFIRESFPGVSLQMYVPAPTLSTLLAGTELLVNDGHSSSISNKGDGLKRTVVFALLRAYATLRGSGLNAESSRDNDSSQVTPAPSYILLFEEPELYLHPRAQRQLMEALATFSNEHQVLVTTHSPGFFRPDTQGFTRLKKTKDGVSALSVALKDFKDRDAYQIIQHENNEAAFFSDSVVLVEGDSDTFTYPHLAKLIEPSWDDVAKNIMFVKINGKGNINRYKQFFEGFNVPIHVITDLDALVDGFRQLTDDPDLQRKQSELLALVNKQNSGISEPKSSKVKKITGRRHVSHLWVEAQQHLAKWRESPTESVADDLTKTLEELFAEGNKDSRLKALQNPSDQKIVNARDSLISDLAQNNVYVLKRGALEDYCKTTIGRDKVESAIGFCKETTHLDDLRKRHGADADDVVKELSDIFSRIYISDSLR